MRNPHFDDGLLVWDDAYSGCYSSPPTGYSEQFELQWRLANEGKSDYFFNPGASTTDQYIQDRIYEWTGRHPTGKNSFFDSSMGIRVLDHPIEPELISGKRCVDIGCGIGRWTRTMLALGAKEVLSIDIAQSAVEATGKINPNVLRGNIMRIPEEHPELVGQFDFANFWGVAMCTNDPLVAFLSAASTVKSGGYLYLMVYAPEGMHNTKLVNLQRKEFYRKKSVSERLAYVENVFDRKWDNRYPFIDNIKNVLRNLMKRPKGSRVGVLDMLEPYYNWVIPFQIIVGWAKRAGFESPLLLNNNERHRCAYHVLMRRK